MQVDKITKYGFTAMEIAALNGRTEVVKLLAKVISLKYFYFYFYFFPKARRQHHVDVVSQPDDTSPECCGGRSLRHRWVRWPLILDSNGGCLFDPC